MRSFFGRAIARAGRSRGRTEVLPQGVDGLFVLLSRAADHSVLWMAIGALLAAGGRRARRGAVRGLIAVGVTSAVTNAVLKPAFRRQRPGHRLPLVPRPGSFSFPSGHSASAFAFATAASRELPGLAPLLMPLAGAVAWSRARTGVHHRADVLIGSAIGAGLGLAVPAQLERRRWRRGDRPADAIGAYPPRFADAVLVTSPRVAGTDDLAAARREMGRRGLAITAEVDVRKAASLSALLQAGRPVLVIAAGGDGTAGAVANCLAGTEHVLGLLPLGTSDNFARSLGIPVDPRRAAALLTDGKIATIDLGRFVPAGQRPRHFVHAATVGLNVSFARIATRGEVRDRLGRFAYLLAAACAMRQRQAFRCELSYAGTAETMTLAQLSVINAPVFGGPLQLSVPASDPDDRLLDMLAIEDITPGRMLLSGAAMLLRARRPVPGIRVWHAPGLRVRADKPLEVTLDGEILSTLPGDFEVAAEALRVITPPGFPDVDD